MRAIKVEYTTKPEYVNTNKANIQKVMEELRAMGNVGVLYSTCVKEDGCSFVHFAISKDEEAAKIIPSLPAFKAFTSQLQAGGLVSPPQTTHLDLVGKSFDL